MARNKWTLEQRTLLWLLNTRFPLATQDIARLFNHIYAVTLAEHGYPDGMKADQLRDEYAQRTTAGKSKMWTEICDADGWQVLEETTINYLWLEALLEEIWHAAEELEIGLAEAADVYETKVGEERIQKAEEMIAQGIVRHRAPGLDARVCNKAYVEAHPTVTFKRIKGADPYREPVEGGAYRRVR